VEILLITTVGQLMEAVATADRSTIDASAADPRVTDPDGTRGRVGAGAGLARLSLAGRIGDYPGATVDPGVLSRMACDWPLRRVLTDERGAVLHHGRSRRLASRAQRQALAARDGGCVIPGCAEPLGWSDVHHVVAWDTAG
jgi:hypothetical protein